MRVLVTVTLVLVLLLPAAASARPHNAPHCPPGAYWRPSMRACAASLRAHARPLHGLRAGRARRAALRPKVVVRVVYRTRVVYVKPPAIRGSLRYLGVLPRLTFATPLTR